MPTRKIVLGLCIFILSLIGSHTCAEESEFYVKEGFYIGGALVHNSIGEDFEGNTGYRYPATGQIAVVPSVDSDLGFGLFAGYRLEKWAFELSYQRVEHDTNNIFTGRQDSDYNVIDFNVKFDVFPQGRFRPYVLVGIGAPWLNVDNVRTDNNGATWSNSTFKGYTVNGGLGMAYYFNQRWFLNAGAIYRWQHFRDIDGLHTSVDAMGSGINFSLGVAYTF